MCRSRRELSNEYVLAKFGLDTDEHEPCKVCPLSVYYYYCRSPRWKTVIRGDPEIDVKSIQGRKDGSDVTSAWNEAHDKFREMVANRQKVEIPC